MRGLIAINEDIAVNTTIETQLIDKAKSAI